jgi:hypothetical protein
MQTKRQALISFFEQVAQKNKLLLKTLKQEECFTIDQECWRFTLPDLHLFLQQKNEIFNHIDYQQFRKLIFSSPVNQCVKPYSAEVTITENHGKVDKSSYALVWHTMK